MNRRQAQVVAAIVAICLTAVLICAACCLTVVFRPQPQGLTPADRAALSHSSVFDQRVAQQVNDKAAVQAAAGKGGTASVDGNDAVGQVNLITGSNPKAGDQVHITFSSPYKGQPIAAITPVDQSPPLLWHYSIDTNGWDIVFDSPPKPNTNYPFSYVIAERPWLQYLGQ